MVSCIALFRRLASWYGASIVEVPIRNVNRERGASHYGISRTFRVFFDLITIRFLLRYLARPLHFFGTVGMVSILGGSGVAGWLMVDKLLQSLGYHGPAWPTHDLRRGPAAGGIEHAGSRPVGRDAGAALSRSRPPRAVFRGSAASRPEQRRTHHLRVIRDWLINGGRASRPSQTRPSKTTYPLPNASLFTT